MTGRNSNDESTHKIRALVLSALMVLSVLAVGAIPAAAQSGNEADPGISVTSQPSGDVSPGSTFDVTYEIANNGNASGAFTVNVINTPSGVSVDSFSGDIQGPNPGGSPPSTSTNAVSAGGTATVTVTYNASSSASGSGAVEVEAVAPISGNTDTQSTSVTVASSSGTPTPTPTPPSNQERSAPGSGGGQIFDGATVFQGEGDIEFAGNLQDSLTGVSGDAEGQVLSPPVPQDQQVGIYSNDGTSGAPQVTVDQPRVTDFEVQNENGEDIAGGSIGKTDANLIVVADYNYEQAEPLELTVEEEGGLDITNDVVAQSAIKNPINSPANPNTDFDVGYTVDLTDQSAGTYTIEVAGEDDLDFGSAVESTTVEVRAQDNVGIEMDSDTVTQGEDVRYEITGSVAGNVHYVEISESDFREGQAADDYAAVFRNVGDVEERGIRVGNNLHERGSEVPSGLDTANIDAAYAVVSIDDDTGLGVGSVETQYLDTVSVTAEVSDPIDPNEAIIQNVADSTGQPEPLPAFGSGDQIDTDDVDFSVEEGTVTLDSPGQTYTVGSEVDVNGTAPTGMDNVAIYVRDEEDFELVTIDGETDIPIDADGTFEEENVVVSEGGAAGDELLQLPGSYRFGVIDASDADLDNDGTPDGILDTQDFNQGTSSQRSLRVIGTSLDAEFTSLVRGQIATEDGDVTVNGSAPGSDEVLLIAVDSRGNTFAESINVDNDDTFDEEDVSLGLREGQISLHVYSVGRDNRVGDGTLPNANNADLGDFETFVNNLEGDSLTGSQVRSSILDETTEAAASDDQLVNQNARITGAQTNILNVYQSDNQASGVNPVAVGETLVVEGQTNLQADDNTVTVELGNEDTTVGLASTEEWGQDGQFSVEVETTDAATGTYTLEVDDGDNTVTEEVELVEQVSTATPTPTEADTTPTATDSPTPTATASPTPTEAPDTETASPTPTEGGGPGFGAVVALVALLAAALLATRRDN